MDSRGRRVKTRRQAGSGKATSLGPGRARVAATRVLVLLASAWALAVAASAPPAAAASDAPAGPQARAYAAPQPGVPALQAPASAPGGAAMVALRPGYGPPGGLQVRWSAPSRSWWSAGLDLDPGRGVLESAWVRRQWRLVPDVLAQVGLEAGYRLGAAPAGDGSAGPWLGVYVGQQWHGGRLLAEIGTSLRLPAAAAHKVWWETALAMGFTW